LPGEIVAGLEVADLTLVADGLMRHVKARDQNAAIAIARIALQLNWRIATDRYEERDGQFCFITELSYDEYEALCEHRDYIIRMLDAQWEYYREVLLSGKARNEAAVRRRLDAIVFLREFIVSACEYHNARKRRARR